MQQGKNTMFMRLHPFVNAMYFVGVMVVTMLCMHPVILGITTIVCFSYLVYLKGSSGFKQNILLIPFILLLSLVNPLFNHAGKTVLFCIKDYSFTLEAFLYGLASAVMIYDMLLLFQVFHIIMTSDKIICVFSKAFPLGALLFTMTLRFVPRYQMQVHRMHVARMGIGQKDEEKRWIQKIGAGVELVSGLFTWSLENALETAESMKGRGFGLKGRTFYSRTEFTRLDRVVLVWEIILIAGILYGAITHSYRITYYPVVRWKPLGIAHLIGYGSYFAFLAIPVLMDGKEEVMWNCLKQNM